MIIIPSIDIQNGKCVRLIQGDFRQETVYGDPVEMAQYWHSQGAVILHVVDLDGARTGIMKNIPTIKRILNKVTIAIQIGGGIRDKKTANDLFNLGVAKIILGTVALENIRLLQELLSIYNDKIIISLDAKNGMLLTRGWKKKSKKKVTDAIEKFRRIGVKNFIYTDILKDGTLSSPNFDEIKKIIDNYSEITISGGISSIEDLEKLEAMKASAVIVGKALYERRIYVN